MAEKRAGKARGGPDAVRAAVEQTFEATAGSVTETRERAVTVLNEVADRGQDAGRQIGGRVADAIGEIRKRLRP